MTERGNFLVIGAGISGAGAASELALDGVTTMLEMEGHPGYHSSGRSAALYTPNYGTALVRMIVAASAEFYRAPPQGFADHPLLTPRQALSFVPAGFEAEIDGLIAAATPATPLTEISPGRACELAPLLRREIVTRAVLDPHVMDMDATAIHQGFLKLFKSRGGRLVTNSRVIAIERVTGAWRVTNAAGTAFVAPIVINAAGAWAGELGLLAGMQPIGLQPKRRTAIIVARDATLAPAAMPAVEDGATGAYVKLDAGRLMASLGDETSSPPCDAQPEDIDMAMIVDWLEHNTHLTVKRIDHGWAGLRNFVTDHSPVAGFDRDGEGFFWLAGQGGYGIMLAAALGRITRALVSRGCLPADLTAKGLTETALAPDRCRA